MANQLSKSLSPYLLEHSRNPVNWYLWNAEAIDLAVSLDRPIFLSIGYSACHWCHVMAQESFESKTIAKLLNENFVSIKVDREERPDIDAVYMLAVQIMTGSGGWPASVFLTPELKPFYAGTYFPPHRVGNMPGFDEVILAVADTWNHRRGETLRYSREITQSLQRFSSTAPVPPIVNLTTKDAAESERAGAGAGAQRLSNSECAEVPSESLIDSAVKRLQEDLDSVWGGFGTSPKFPEVSSLELLMRYGHRTGEKCHWEAVRLTLLSMCRGGVYDLLGGGFSRYSVDAMWSIPHFEKMLYDNALLSRLYVDAYRHSGEQVFADVASQTMHYMIDVLGDPSGGLCSSEDADSLDSNNELEEGAYYTWTLSEIVEVLGQQDARIFAEFYGVTLQGNFQGANVLRITQGIETLAARYGKSVEELSDCLSSCRRKLLARRDQRVHPRKDEKVLTGWNAMAIKALAVGGIVLQEPKFSDAAERIGDFLWTDMRQEGVGLLHAWYHGTAHLPAYADDYACLIDAYVTLYETSGRARWIGRATRLAEEMLDKFEDKEFKGLYFTSFQSESLIARTKEWHDASTPSSNGVAAMALTRLGRAALRDDFLHAARRILQAAEPFINRQPRACAKLLSALDYWYHGGKQWILTSAQPESIKPYSQRYFGRYRPNTNVAWVLGAAPEKGPMLGLLREKHPSDCGVTLYECYGRSCQAPISDPQSVLERLDETN